MRKSIQAVLIPILVGLALVAAAPAAADAPATATSTVTFGPFVDNETCAFPITVTVDRTRRTTSYANGDARRHTQLIVTASANGKTVLNRNAFNVFIDADSLADWVITGVFEKAQVQGRTIWLQSGRLVFDLEADELVDPNPGPLAEATDTCELLAP